MTCWEGSTDESAEPVAGCRSAPATAKAGHISRSAMKLCCACEWGGSGRLSVDGLGQHNPNRSEDPWSRATHVARMAVLHRAGGPDLERGFPCCNGEHEGWTQT